MLQNDDGDVADKRLTWPEAAIANRCSGTEGIYTGMGITGALVNHNSDK